MDIPALANSRPYRPETIALLHDAFEAFWHKDFLKAWKLSVLVSAAPLHVEVRPGGCAPEILEALRGEMLWAMDELNSASKHVIDLHEAGRCPGDIEVGVDPIDEMVCGEGHTDYGRSLGPLPADLAGLSIHGRIGLSRHFLAAHWREPAQLRRVCLQYLAEALGMRHADIATMWCSETSALFPRQIHALCALQDVREFFERQPCVQAWIDNPIWPRRLPQLPTHAVCDVRTSSENQDSPTHWTAAARPPKCVS